MLIYSNGEKVVLRGEKNVYGIGHRDFKERGYTMIGSIQGGWGGVKTFEDDKFIKIQFATDVKNFLESNKILPEYMIPKLAKQLSDQRKMLLGIERRVQNV